MTELIDMGFTRAGTCRCDGTLTEKFRRGKFMVKIRPRRYSFAIFEQSNRVTDWQNISQLDEAIKKHIPPVQTKA